jgi:uncharacterized membrane protein
MAHRAVLLLASIGMLWGIWQTSNTEGQFPSSAVLSAISLLGTLVCAVGAFVAATERAIRRFEWILLVVALLVMAGWATSALQVGTATYGTDEGAFVHYAAELLRRGIDPYGPNLLPGMRQFGVPISWATFTMDGHTISTLGYPPLSVLLTAVTLSISGHAEAVVVVNMGALCLSAVLGFILLPAEWRAMAVLATVGMPALIEHAFIGVNAIMVLPLMVVVVHRWTAVGRRGSLSRGDIIRAICLGLAASTQQIVWFVIPFLLAGMILLRRGELPWRSAIGVVARYTAVAGAVFAMVNLPFAVWDPGTWATGITGPLFQQALPLGQGLIGLSAFAGVGGGELMLFSLGGLLLLAAMFVAYVLQFRRIGSACFILPAAAFYLTTRSLMVYFAVPVVFWIVSLLSVDRSDFARAWQPTLPE